MRVQSTTQNSLQCISFILHFLFSFLFLVPHLKITLLRFGSDDVCLDAFSPALFYLHFSLLLYFFLLPSPYKFFIQAIDEFSQIATHLYDFEEIYILFLYHHNSESAISNFLKRVLCRVSLLPSTIHVNLVTTFFSFDLISSSGSYSIPK